MSGITLSLLDHFARASKTSDGRALAEVLIEGAMGEYRAIREMERVCFADPRMRDDEFFEAAVTKLWKVYSSWSASTRKLIKNLEHFQNGKRGLGELHSLQDAYGLVMARLNTTPSKLAAARKQSRTGKFTSGADLRRELSTRVHRKSA